MNCKRRNTKKTQTNKNVLIVHVSSLKKIEFLGTTITPVSTVVPVCSSGFQLFLGKRSLIFQGPLCSTTLPPTEVFRVPRPVRTAEYGHLGS